MTIVVMDGQGGRVGAMLIEALRRAGCSAPHRLLAVGSNALATAAMLKAGADQGATGENAAVVTAARADVIAGPLGILMADAMLGEITERMASAVGRSPAVRVLLPMERCGTLLPGTEHLPLSKMCEEAADMILRQRTVTAEA